MTTANIYPTINIDPNDEAITAVCDSCFSVMVLINGEGECSACKHRHPECGDCLNCFTLKKVSEGKFSFNDQPYTICDTCGPGSSLDSCGHTPACDCCDFCNDPCWFDFCVGCGEKSPTHLEWEDAQPDSVVEANEADRKTWLDFLQIRV